MNGGVNECRQSKKLAENFVKAASELIEATGGTYLNASSYDAPSVSMPEVRFDKVFDADVIEIKARDCNTYPIEKVHYHRRR